jgi:hypothetical protein
MNVKTDTKHRIDKPTTGNVTAQHEPLRHHEIYVSLLFSLIVSLLG